MHLGLVGPAGPDLFVDNIADTLSRMGHRVSLLGSARAELAHRTGRLVRLAAVGAELALTRLPSVESRYHRRLVRRAHELGCDAVINTDGTVLPDTVADLRRYRIPTALWFADAVCNLGSQRMLLAPYTAMFFKDPLLVERLRATLDAPVEYLPEACNPRWHQPAGPAGTEPVIVVAGNVYPSRLVLLRRLHDAGIPLVVYGVPAAWARGLLPPGMHTGRPVFREEKSRVYRRAAGVLNNLHPAEMHSVNCRLFEATGAGAAVLCERRPVLADLFDTEREVVPFGDFAELVERARELLDDPGRTGELGDAASKRAHAEHSYEARLTTILERIL